MVDPAKAVDVVPVARPAKANEHALMSIRRSGCADHKHFRIASFVLMAAHENETS